MSFTIRFMRFFALSIILLFVLPLQTHAESEEFSYQADSEEIALKEATLYLFYSPTCPYCTHEKNFLEKIKDKYPTLTIDERNVASRENHPLMESLAKQYDVEYALGGVPLTFIGEKAFVGFRDEKTTGKEIEEAIQHAVGWQETDSRESGSVVSEESNRDNSSVNKEGGGISFNVPFLGVIYVEDFSLPVLAIVLGFLDGFNVCSLGALVLIIGLTLKLQRRKAILLLGGVFIVTTAVVYGALIFMWAKVFGMFATYIDTVKILVAILSIGGGMYFLKEYFRMRKQGSVCQLQESRLIQRLTEHTGKAFENKTKLVSLLGVVFLFAAVIAIVEFPCSAATPLIFAGVLVSAGISEMAQFGYIALFILFYMLDELLVFGIAAYRLKLWMTSGTFTKYAVLAEAIILIVLGVIFLTPVLKAFGL